MKKIVVATIFLSVLVFTPVVFVYAQDSDLVIEDVLLQLQEQINTLQQQIEDLKAELAEMRAQFKFTTILRRGVRSDEVKELQEFLKQFPDIYPEGLVTGYFGPLTEIAVQRLQEKFNIVSSGTSGTTGYGQVGPKTRERLIELITNSVGSSALLPPEVSTPLEVQESIATSTVTTASSTTTPSGTIPATPATPPSGGGGGGTTPATPATPAEPTPDTTPPVISNIQTINITETSADITWATDESADSKISYALSSLVTASSTIDISETNYVTSHNINLSGLTQSTQHYYVIVSADTNGNVSTSSEQSFTTLTPPAPPQSEALSILQSTQFYHLVYPGADFAAIYVTCPAQADVVAGIIYGKNSDTTINDGNLEGLLGVQGVFNCSSGTWKPGIQLWRIIQFPPSTDFNYQVVFFEPGTNYGPQSASNFPELGFSAGKIYTAEDTVNEVYRLPVKSFTTLSSADITPPTFTVQLSELTSSSVKIDYTSSGPLVGGNYIFYSTEPVGTGFQEQRFDIGDSLYLDNSGVHYSGALTDLTASTTYHYRIWGSKQTSGLGGTIIDYSPDTTFTTASE